MSERVGAGPHYDARAIPDGGVEGVWFAPEGDAVRRLDLAPVGPVSRGSLLFVPGRGDTYEKYLESFCHWRAQGWHVTAIDWRGQAGSGRFGRDNLTGHVDDFTVWLRDLGAFWQTWRATHAGPHVLVGHSMGGHLALRAVADGYVDSAATVLSTPMLGFYAWGLPLVLQHALAAAMVRIGDPRRPAWRDGEKPATRLAVRMALLTHDRGRYCDEQWWRAQRPYLEMGPASWGWMERALDSMRHLAAPGVLERVTTPVLLLSTSADRMVSHRAICTAARRLPQGELVIFGREARHEILREVDPVRDRALAAIDSFLDRHLPLPKAQT